jgi:membrane-associated phospholipid phosphatase
MHCPNKLALPASRPLGARRKLYSSLLAAGLALSPVMALAQPGLPPPGDTREPAAPPDELAPAQADTPAPSGAAPVLVPGPAPVRAAPRGRVHVVHGRVEVDDGHRLHWTYPRFRLWQVIASVGVTGTGYFLQSGIKGDFPNGSWNTGILFDDAARDGLVAGTVEGRKNAALISDKLWHITQYYPIVVDSLFVPLVTDRFNADVALQMNLINWQVQGLAFLFTRLSHRLVGRARPSLQECERNPGYDGYCDPRTTGEHASFVGGHVSMAASGAGLVCAHHQALPLYGGNAADIAICGLAIASAATAGTLRVVADKHWMSDIVVGAAMGGAIGYGLPYLLHYRHGKLRGFGAELLPKDTIVYPLASSTDVGLGMAGMF